MKTGKTIKGALYYNEQKVKAGNAELLLAAGFSTDINELSLNQKMQRFSHLIQRNTYIKTNTLHLSLNFPPEEVLGSDTLQSIARDYMEKIGFGDQPYLVYRHDDSSHPHIHIVTTTIQANGKAISLHNIGREKSEPARKSIELEYGLIKAEDRKKEQAIAVAPAQLNPALYGKGETKRVISNIVREVVSGYKFKSLEELNAILRQFNILADTGSTESMQYARKGLVYTMLDENGYKTGTAIKASMIYSSPTLKNLEKKFEQNKIKQIASLKYVRPKVNYIISASRSPDQLQEKLQKKNIQLYVSRDSAGNIQNLHFVDHSSRAVFSASELGWEVQTILNKIHYRIPGTSDPDKPKEKHSDQSQHYPDIIGTLPPIHFAELMTILFKDQSQQNHSSPAPRKRKKKKRNP